MSLSTLTERARALTHDVRKTDGLVVPSPGLVLLRHEAPTELRASLYEPVICLILQGRKEVAYGAETVGFGAGEMLLVSHDLPVVSQITQAPYLALILTLDLGVLRGLYDELEGVELDGLDARSMAVDRADAALIDVLRRMLDLADDPVGQRVLTDSLVREAHFRLLTGPAGGMLRQLVRHDTPASHIGRAITAIRRGYRESLTVSDLARSVGMSESSFYAHFKAITATTPLQYQKRLRLLEARRLLTAEARSVSEAAYEVGYESPSQFSREYARAFGLPPSREATQAP